MKVTCPECSSEFDVPQDALGPMGKRVRCASCKHIWFQEPVAEEEASAGPQGSSFGGFRRFDESFDIEPIPASVHPDADHVARDDDDDDDEDGEKGPGFFADINYGYLSRMVLGFVLGMALLGASLVAIAEKGAAPAFFASMATALGADVGASDALKVQDVVFAQNEVDGVAVTDVKGRIVNTSKDEQAIPVLDVTPVDINGIEAEGVRVKPEQEILKPEEAQEFGARLQGAPPEGGHIRIRFTR